MVRVQAVFLRRFNQALDHGAGLRATERIGKEPIFPPHHKWLNAALDTLFLYADNVPYAHDIFILIFIAICAGRRPQMRCSAAGLRSQRPPFNAPPFPGIPLLSETEKIVSKYIAEVLAVPTGNDFVTFKASKTEPIAVQRKYHGVSTQITGYIKNVRVPFNVDIGVGDVIVPRPERRNIQTQLEGYEKPEILTYSLESTIAEKFDAILQRFELTGRMKDFYDIYYLSRTFNFDGLKLQTAIQETLQNRGTAYEKDSFERIIALAEDADMQIK